LLLNNELLSIRPLLTLLTMNDNKLIQNVTRFCATIMTKFLNYLIQSDTVAHRRAVDEVNSLVDDVSGTIAQNTEHVGHCRLHWQSAHAQTVPRRAARDHLLRD